MTPKEAVYEVQEGEGHTVALKADGTVWTWGANGNGQLGDGTYADKSQPVQILSGTTITQISTLSNHTLALDKDGYVWAWGLNNYGQLGTGTVSNRNTPARVLDSDGNPLKNIVRIAAGSGYSVALDENMQVWIWGQGYGRTAIKLTNFNNVFDISSKYALFNNGEVKDLANGSPVPDVGGIRHIKQCHRN